ncbi:MAG: hypothetical protein JOZ23_15860 [Mycobacterium sp.]|nr:hypothetical protein [Mycobacterium sp.]
MGHNVPDDERDEVLDYIDAALKKSPSSSVSFAESLTTTMSELNVYRDQPPEDVGYAIAVTLELISHFQQAYRPIMNHLYFLGIYARETLGREDIAKPIIEWLNDSMTDLESTPMDQLRDMARAVANHGIKKQRSGRASRGTK